jgi:hypothetical protein
MVQKAKQIAFNLGGGNRASWVLKRRGIPGKLKPVGSVAFLDPSSLICVQTSHQF